MMRKCLWVLWLTCLLQSCNSIEDLPQPKPKESMTILCYLVANNNLEDDLQTNIGTMYDGLSVMKEPATLLIYWDGKNSIGENNSKHLILKYHTDGNGFINGIQAADQYFTTDEIINQAEIVQEYPEQLSTDKTVMTKVLRDMMAEVHSDKIGLILGSHASSWLNSIYTSRAFGQDGSGTDNTMLIPDMVEALKSVGKPFEFILFDACYMGTMEVAYAFRDVTHYQISSVMEVPAYGFPYELFMSELYGGTISNYQNVCQTYIDYYNDLYSYGEYAWATVSLIDSKEITILTDLLRQEISANKDTLANYDIRHLQEYGRISGPYIANDLGHFVKDLNGGTLPDTFSNQLAKTVVYKGCLEKARPFNYGVNIANYSGLGIYIPVSARPKWNAYFKTLDWYTTSGWNEVTFSWDF
ncbi:MAG: clostripain [Bacteroidaceae bacterium]|nr:clostripain [Bacteroidaceae bacterium]